MSGASAPIRAGARFLALVLFFASCFIVGRSDHALAHAGLLKTNPAADSVVTASPDAITLEFNEPVQILGLRLIDATGKEHGPPGDPVVQNALVTWPLAAALPSGRYLVSWRVSSLDGHMVSGSFNFAVGSSAPGSQHLTFSGAPSAHWPALGLHALSRLLMLFAVGTTLFNLLLLNTRRLRTTARRLALCAFGATVIFMATEGAMRAGLSPALVISIESFRAAMAAPGISMRLLMLGGLGVLALGSSRPSQTAGALLAVVGMGDSGHILPVLPKGIGHGLIILHGFTAALWIGAIWPLRAALRDSGPASVDLFRRFQRYGAIAMGGTLASGIFLTWYLLPEVSDLWQSAYGLRLCAKLAAVTVMGGIAATNRFWLTPQTLANRPGARQRLRVVLGLDLVAAMLAVVLAVGLSLGPPPAGRLQLAVTTDRYDVRLILSPGKIGDNDLLIALTPRSDAPIDPSEVTVRVSSASIEPIARRAERLGSGRYRLGGLPLWAPGVWTFRIGVLVDDFTKVEATADVILDP